MKGFLFGIEWHFAVCSDYLCSYDYESREARRFMMRMMVHFVY